eukprot:UN07862
MRTLLIMWIVVAICIPWVNIASTTKCDTTHVHGCYDNTGCSESAGNKYCNVGDDNCWQCLSSPCCLKETWYYDVDCGECESNASSYAFIVGVIIMLALCGCCIGCCKAYCSKQQRNEHVQNNYAEF